MRVLNCWIVVESTPSLWRASAIWSRFFSMRCGNGADRPGSGSTR
jgi:hypothetical protein